MSENHTIVSANFNAGVWTTDSLSGGWSTAVDTRSLSYVLLPVADTGNNSTTNVAFLFYENSTTNISVLVQRSTITTSATSVEVDTEWVDITSQRSKSLPDAFRNDPIKDLNSSTLYESATDLTFSTPFTSTANFSQGGALLVFYAPRFVSGIQSTNYGSDDGSGKVWFTEGKNCAYSNSH